MWDIMKKSKAIRDEEWVCIDEKLASVETVTIAVQVNGKLRGTFDIDKDADNSKLEEKALELLANNVTRDMCKKIITVPNRIVNVVI